MWHTEDNRYSFRVAFIELRVRRSTAAHGWLAVSPSPRPSWRPTTPVIAAGRDRCFQCILYTTTTPAVPDFTCHLCARTDRPRRAVLFDHLGSAGKRARRIWTRRLWPTTRKHLQPLPLPQQTGSPVCFLASEAMSRCRPLLRALLFADLHPHPHHHLFRA